MLPPHAVQPALRIRHARLFVPPLRLFGSKTIVLLLRLGADASVVASLHQALPPLLLKILLVERVVGHVDQRKRRRLLCVKRCISNQCARLRESRTRAHLALSLFDAEILVPSALQALLDLGAVVVEILRAREPRVLEPFLWATGQEGQSLRRSSRGSRRRTS